MHMNGFTKISKQREECGSRIHFQSYIFLYAQFHSIIPAIMTTMHTPWFQGLLSVLPTATFIL